MLSRGGDVDTELVGTITILDDLVGDTELVVATELVAAVFREEIEDVVDVITTAELLWVTRVALAETKLEVLSVFETRVELSTCVTVCGVTALPDDLVALARRVTWLALGCNDADELSVDLITSTVLFIVLLALADAAEVDRGLVIFTVG